MGLGGIGEEGESIFHAFSIIGKSTCTKVTSFHTVTDINP